MSNQDSILPPLPLFVFHDEQRIVPGVVPACSRKRNYTPGTSGNKMANDTHVFSEKIQNVPAVPAKKCIQATLRENCEKAFICSEYSKEEEISDHSFFFAGTAGTEHKTAPASTCSTLKRIVLPSPTLAQWEGMNARTYSAAALLRQRLVASGFDLRVSREAGALRFDEPRLLIEYQSIAPDDWNAIFKYRTELFHQLGPPTPHIAEFDAGAAYTAAPSNASA